MRQQCLIALFMTCFWRATGAFIRYNASLAKPYNATFDGRSLFVDGRRSLFVSGSIHPPRVHEDDWPAALAQARGLGLNMVDVYVVRFASVTALARPASTFTFARATFSPQSLPPRLVLEFPPADGAWRAAMGGAR